jgi:hypothetical protein
MLGSQPYGSDHVLLVFGNHHTNRLYLVDAGVGAVESLGVSIEAHFAFDLLLKLTLYVAMQVRHQDCPRRTTKELLCGSGFNE